MLQPLGEEEKLNLLLDSKTSSCNNAENYYVVYSEFTYPRKSCIHFCINCNCISISCTF